MAGPEFDYVENPFIDQLVSMGWKHTTGSLDHPSVSGRENFDQVLLESELRDALRRINLDPNGNPWLDDARLNQAVSRIERITAHKLMEANQEATEVLLKGTDVEGREDWDGGLRDIRHALT